MGTGVTGGRMLGGAIASSGMLRRCASTDASAGLHMRPWHDPIPARVIRFTWPRSPAPSSRAWSTRAAVTSSHGQITVSDVISSASAARGAVARPSAARDL